VLKGKTRVIILSNSMRRKLIDYIQREKIEEGPVFTSKAGIPICRVTVWKRMKKLCSAARVDPKKVFPHNLRHLLARIFYEVNKDIAKLADILGHSSIETTRIYITESGTEHLLKIDKLHLVI